MPQPRVDDQREERHPDAALPHGGPGHGRPGEARDQAGDAGVEHRRLRQQAQHHEGLAREVEEVAGMHQHAVALARRSSTSASSPPVAGTWITADHPPGGS